MNRKSVLAGSRILAMIDALARVKRIPEKEWFSPIIEELERIYKHPGEKFILERSSK